MNEHNNMKELLGMNQENMSMLLQITRSQWAMYVTGKRDLPHQAKLKLIEMLGFLQQKNKTIYKNTDYEKKQVLIISKFVATQQLLNSKQQSDCKLKLEAAEKKYKTALTARQFISFLESTAQKQTATYQLLLETLKRDAETQMEKNGLAVQSKLQYQQEMLRMEEKMLQKKLEDIDNVYTDDLL